MPLMLRRLSFHCLPADDADAAADAATMTLMPPMITASSLSSITLADSRRRWPPDAFAAADADALR